MSQEGNPAINVENERSKIGIMIINHIVMRPAINVELGKNCRIIKEDSYKLINILVLIPLIDNII